MVTVRAIHAHGPVQLHARGRGRILVMVVVGLPGKDARDRTDERRLIVPGGGPCERHHEWEHDCQHHVRGVNRLTSAPTHLASLVVVGGWVAEGEFHCRLGFGRLLGGALAMVPHEDPVQSATRPESTKTIVGR